MSHYPANPSRGAVRRVPTYRTSEPGWAERAIDDLLDYQDVVVDGVFVAAHELNPRIPIWRQLRRRLLASGIRVPREVPDDDPCFPGRMGTLGATGPAG